MRATTITTAALALGTFWLLGAPALAQDPAAPEADAPETAAAKGPVFKYQTGNIVLPNKVATLHLGGNYRYLDPAETEKLLVAWGNPPGSDTQGAIVPNDVDPMGEEGWAVILTYVDDGHVDDSDAAEIDYDDLLEDMKKGTDGPQRGAQEGGLPARAPRSAGPRSRTTTRPAKKLYWAKELRLRRQPGSARSTTTCACWDVKACCR